MFRQGPVGGDGGGAYSLTPDHPDDRISSVNCRSGAFVDRLIVTFVRSNGQHYTKETGGNGGGLGAALDIPRDDAIAEVSGRSGSFVDFLEIRTRRGRVQRWGGPGGLPYTFLVPGGNNVLVGFWGRSGAFVDGLGVDYLTQ